MLKKKYTSENHVDGAGVHERGGGGDLSSRMLWMKSSEPRLEVRWMYKHLLTAKCLLSVAEGANAGDDPRETALIWPLMPSHLVDVRYFVSNREWNYRLRFRGREREREKCEKKRTRRGKNEYTFGPRAKYIRSCRKRMNYPCMARMKKRRGKKIGVKTQKRKKIALYSALGKNVYITRKNIYFKMFQKKRCKKKNEETWSFAYGRPPESLASAEDNWITPLWSLYISA